MRQNSLAETPRPAPAKPEGRSAISNGKTLFLPGVDGRSREARRFRDLLTGFLDKTGGRYVDVCRALAAMCVERERLESKMACGEVIDTDLLLRLASEIRRSCERLGLIEEPAEDVVLPPDAPSWLVGRRESAESVE
jgi:hypothetical protein